MSAAKKRASAPDPFPALTQFLSGYLHEDFVLDHKTPEGARAAFLKDANARERAAQTSTGVLVVRVCPHPSF